MLSYMIPVETKQTSPTMTTAMATTQNLNLALNLNNNDIIEKSTTTTNSSTMMNTTSSERQISSSEFITTTTMTTTQQMMTTESDEKQHSVIECDLDEKINMVNEKLQHQTLKTDTTTSSVIAAADKSKLTKLNLKNAPLKR